MTTTEFNSKYFKYLDTGHYGLAIHDTRVIKYMDDEFQIEIKRDPLFKYQQIKLKWDFPTIYSSSRKNNMWERNISKILDNE